MVSAPLLTMSSLAGERSNGTLPLWFAAGLPASRIVLGKYFALMIWLVLWLVIALAMPLSLAHGIALDGGKLAAASLGALLTLAALAAIGVASSAYASHASIAATIALTIGLALAGMNIAAQKAGMTGGAFNWIALSGHVEDMLRGLVAVSDVVWFVLVILVSLVLATQRLAADKERG